MSKNLLGLSLRMLRRDWRAGELRLLFVALVVAVASVTSVGFFTDRIAQALQRQANDLLGADLLLVASQPLTDSYLETARKLGLQRATTINFLSMVLAGDKNQLSDIKAVSPGYPLRGQLQIADRVFAAGNITRAIPAPGTAWVDASLLNQLGLKVGDKITAGAVELIVTAVLVQEPDRGGDFFNIAPRLMMNVQDVPKTGLIQVGSRVKYRLLVAGEAAAVNKFRDYAQARPDPAVNLQSIDDARPEVRSALQRAEQFLGLAALVSVLLASVAVASSVRRFTLRHLDNCAVMRCLGATQATITRLYTLQMLYLGILASLIGCALGYLAQMMLVNLLGGLVAAELPLPSLRPVGFGLLTGLITLLGFALPPLLALKNVSTLRVLRREIGLAQPQSLSVYVLGLVLLAGLILWQAGDIKLGVYLVLGTLAALALFSVVAYGLVRLLNLLRARGGVAWRFGLANIARRASSSVTQIVALAIGIMALLLLTLVRGDLLESWQGSLPPEAPNRFIINIQPEQLSELQAFFQHHAMPKPQLYPLVRARLIMINGKPTAPEDYQDERAERLAEREFNVSWAHDFPSHNQLVAGQWWDANDADKNLLSLEQGVAKTLGLKLGDTMTYSVGDAQFTATVTNLRKVDWDSMRVNFFVIATPGVLANYPASYITSLYVPETKSTLLNELVQAFPNFTVIDVAAIMTQVRRIIERVSLAVEYVFLFTVAAGFLVLYAAIQSTQDERMHESAILRTLGASRRRLLQGLITEFAVLGLLSGLLAAIAASALGYILAKQVLDLPYTFNPGLWIAGMLVGVLGVGLVGALGARSILRQPPLLTLRQV
ncbi:MAG: FtsX-like permease family protein [Gammaproteobacteria bacterium]